MNVLQVSPIAAYPPRGGGQHRVHGLMTGRRDADRVFRFASACVSEGSGTVEIAPDYREVRYASHLRSALGFAVGRVVSGHVFSSELLRVTRPRDLSTLVEWADVVVTEFPWQVAYVDRLRPSETPLVYSSHNFELDEFQSLSSSRLAGPLRRKVERIEREAVRTADLVVVTTDRDRRLYREQLGASGEFHVAPNAASTDAVVDPDAVGRKGSGAVGREGLDAAGQEGSGAVGREGSDPDHVALFVGSNHAPNVEAVREILSVARDPGIRERSVEFLVVGSVCDAFDGITPPPNVELAGYVEDLDPYYRRADVGLNPVRSGGGANVKVPEYFARGLAVVTTEYGSRGVPAESGRHWVVADEGVADALVDLVDHPDRIAGLGANARDLVAERLNWEAVSADLFEELSRLAG